MPARPLLAALLAVVLTHAAPAAAAPVTPIGVGEDAVADFDAAGHLHVAWERPGGKVAVCEVPAGGTACSPAAVELPQPLSGGSPAEVADLNIFARPDGSVELYGELSCNGALWNVVRYVRPAGSTTWSAPACKLSGLPGHAVPTTNENWLDDSGRFYAAGGASSGYYLNVLPPGTATSTFNGTENPIFSTANFYDESVGIVGDGAASRLVVAADSQDSAPDPVGAVYSVFKLPPETASTAQLNTPSNWVRSLPLPGADESSDTPKVAADGADLLVVSAADGSFGTRVQASRLSPGATPETARFGAPVRIGGNEQQTNWDVDLAAGKAHVVWRTDGGDRLRYARSDDAGGSWAVQGTLTTERLDPNARVHARPDGSGVVVAGRGDQVVLIPLDATPDPVQTPVAPPTGSGGAGSGGGAGTGSGAGTPPPALGLGGAPRTSVVAVDRTTVLALAVPAARCVRPGQAFTVRMRLQARKRKGRVVVKLRSASFFLDGRRVALDRRAPFQQLLRVAATARPGTTIRLRATGTIRVRSGKQRRRSVTRTFRVCG